jgi:hypothetical protein
MPIHRRKPVTVRLLGALAAGAGMARREMSGLLRHR